MERRSVGGGPGPAAGRVAGGPDVEVRRTRRPRGRAAARDRSGVRMARPPSRMPWGGHPARLGGTARRSRRSRSVATKCAVGPPPRRHAGGMRFPGAQRRRRPLRTRVRPRLRRPPGGARTAPSWLRIAGRRAPHRQAVHLVVSRSAAASRGSSARPSRPARRAGTGRPAARGSGRPRPARRRGSARRSASATTGVTSKSLTGIQNRSSRPDDAHAGGDRDRGRPPRSPRAGRSRRVGVARAPPCRPGSSPRPSDAAVPGRSAR